jgi:hypothetical protein
MYEPKMIYNNNRYLKIIKYRQRFVCVLRKENMAIVRNFHLAFDLTVIINGTLSLGM